MTQAAACPSGPARWKMHSIAPLAFAQMVAIPTCLPNSGLSFHCSLSPPIFASKRIFSSTKLRMLSSLVGQSDVERRRYLAVPYAEKDQAKALGARWDPQAKLWYDPGPDHNAQLDRWNKLTDRINEIPVPKSPEQAPVAAENTRKYLAVPYNDKDKAKALGARWDNRAKQWYDPTGSNPELNQWEAPPAK